MEGVLRNLQNMIVYIDVLLIHSDTHERHLQTLEQVLQRLQQNHLKINLEKCIFGNKEVSYLGFTLTPEGIKPGKNKLKAIETAKIPEDVKTIRSFMGLCNFFRTHIKNFAIVVAPCSNSPGRTLDTREDHCPRRPKHPSIPSEGNSSPNRSWLSQNWIANTL
jgi:hypothetical protein